MADWLDVVIEILLELAETHPDLEREIRLAVRRIERNPLIGRYVRNTRYIYTDPDFRFRIGYNYHPRGKEIEIAVINVFKSF